MPRQLPAAPAGRFSTGKGKVIGVTYAVLPFRRLEFWHPHKVLCSSAARGRIRPRHGHSAASRTSSLLRSQSLTAKLTSAKPRNQHIHSDSPFRALPEGAVLPRRIRRKFAHGTSALARRTFWNESGRSTPRVRRPPQARAAGRPSAPTGRRKEGCATSGSSRCPGRTGICIIAELKRAFSVPRRDPDQTSLLALLAADLRTGRRSRPFRRSPRRISSPPRWLDLKEASHIQAKHSDSCEKTSSSGCPGRRGNHAAGAADSSFSSHAVLDDESISRHCSLWDVRSKWNR